jgi:hypothetical protein
VSRGTILRASGSALLVFAAHAVARDFIFAFTHGSSEGAVGATLLGFKASQYAALWTPFPLLAAVGLAGVYLETAPRIGTTARVGLGAAMVGFALWFAAGIMQTWILDPDRYFYSPLVQGGWYLSLFAMLITALGMIGGGLAIARRAALPGPSVVLLIGLLALPTVVGTALVVANSTDSLAWRLAYGSISVPYDACWAWLGLVLVGRVSERGPSPRSAAGRG